MSDPNFFYKQGSGLAAGTILFPRYLTRIQFDRGRWRTGSACASLGRETCAHPRIRSGALAIAFVPQLDAQGSS